MRIPGVADRGRPSDLARSRRFILGKHWRWSPEYWARTFVKWGLCGRGQLQRSRRHPWPLAFILVLEEQERVAPGLLLHPLHPSLEFCVAVIGPSQSQIAPIRCRYKRNFEGIIGVDDAQRRAMIAEQ